MWVKAARWWVKKGSLSDCEKRTCDNHVSRWWREKWRLHDTTAPPAKCTKSIEKVYDLYDSFYEDSDSEYGDHMTLNAINYSLHTEIASGSAMDIDSEIADAAGFSDDVEYDSVSIGSEESDDDRQVPYLSLSSNTDMNLQCAALSAASKRSSSSIVSLLKFAQYICDHFATCANCKGKKATGNSQEWIVDSECLQGGLQVRRSSSKLNFYNKGQCQSLVSYPLMPGQTIFWVSLQKASACSLMAKSTMDKVDYKTHADAVFSISNT
ncbi:hypothetical protein PM082_004364 [Marasmius tenuissimus]|nr:hypothetical protein PM082_004364 [Marasmius tenuissimus]